MTSDQRHTYDAPSSTHAPNFIPQTSFTLFDILQRRSLLRWPITPSIVSSHECIMRATQSVNSERYSGAARDLYEVGTLKPRSVICSTASRPLCSSMNVSPICHQCLVLQLPCVFPRLPDNVRLLLSSVVNRTAPFVWAKLLIFVIIYIEAPKK